MNKPKHKFFASIYYDANASEPDEFVGAEDLRTMLNKVKRLLLTGNGNSKARISGPNNSYCWCRVREDWWGNGLKYVFTYRWHDAIHYERYIEHGISAGNL